MRGSLSSINDGDNRTHNQTNVPYFRMTSRKSRCILPPETIRTSHSRERVARSGPLKCRNRYQLRKVCKAYTATKKANITIFQSPTDRFGYSGNKFIVKILFRALFYVVDWVLRMRTEKLVECGVWCDVYMYLPNTERLSFSSAA